MCSDADRYASILASGLCEPLERHAGLVHNHMVQDYAQIRELSVTRYDERGTAPTILAAEACVSSVGSTARPRAGGLYGDRARAQALD